MTTPVFDLCDDFVTRSAQLDPIFATMRGIAGPTAGVATDFSPDGVAARADLVDGTLRRLDALTPTGDDDRLAAMHLRERLQVEHDAHALHEPLRNLRAPFGLLNTLRDSVDLMPRNDDDQWAAVAERLDEDAGDARRLARHIGARPSAWALCGTTPGRGGSGAGPPVRRR